MKFELELMDARREGMEKGETKGIYALIHTLRDLGIDEAVIKQKVMSNFNLSDADATKYLQN